MAPFLIVSGVALYIDRTIVVQTVKYMRDAASIMCDGELDFVYTLHPATRLPFTAGIKAANPMLSDIISGYAGSALVQRMFENQSVTATVNDTVANYRRLFNMPVDLRLESQAFAEVDVDSVTAYSKMS